MRKSPDIRSATANDNDSLQQFPRGDAVGFRAHVIDKQREYQDSVAENGIMELSEAYVHPMQAFFPAIVVWLATLSVFTWSFLSAQSIGLRLGAAVVLIWGALWVSYTARGGVRARIGEIAMLTALLGFVGTLMMGATQLGLPLRPVGAVSLFCAATLAVAWLTGSHMALMASVSAGLAWGALQLDGYLPASFMTATVPLLWVGQIITALKLKSHIGMFAVAIVGYVWIGGLAWAQYTAGALSPVWLAAGLPVIAATHFNGARLAGETGLNSAPMHILFAWGLGLTGLIVLQHYFLYPGHVFWASASEGSSLTKVLWLLVMLCALGGFALICLIRWATGYSNLFAGLLSTLLLALIPGLIWFEPAAVTAFETMAALPARQSAGLFIGGGVIVSAVTLILKTVRERHYLLTILAIGALGLEIRQMMQREFFTGQNITIILAGGLLALALSNILFQNHAPVDRKRKALKQSRGVVS